MVMEGISKGISAQNHQSDTSKKNHKDWLDLDEFMKKPIGMRDFVNNQQENVKGVLQGQSEGRDKGEKTTKKENKESLNQKILRTILMNYDGY